VETRINSQAFAIKRVATSIATAMEHNRSMELGPRLPWILLNHSLL
jgi:hypothetical protein